MCGPSRSSGSSALRRVARWQELVGIFRMELALSQTKFAGTTASTRPNPEGVAVTIEGETTTSYPMSPRNRVKRLHERGSYDQAKIHGLLDASMLCHVSYVVDGQPYCTPTFFWREGNTLYWHGSSASRMLRNQSDGQTRMSHRRASRQPGAGKMRLQSFGGLPRRDGVRHRLSRRRSRREGARAGRHGRPFLPRSHREPAAKHGAGDQGDIRHRDGDRSRRPPKFAPRASATTKRTMHCRSMPSAFRCAPCWARPNPVRGFSTASSGRRRWPAIRKAACSKTHCGMRILRITPAAEIGVGCGLPTSLNSRLEPPHDDRYATENPRRRRCRL